MEVGARADDLPENSPRSEFRGWLTPQGSGCQVERASHSIAFPLLCDFVSLPLVETVAQQQMFAQGPQSATSAMQTHSILPSETWSV